MEWKKAQANVSTQNSVVEYMKSFASSIVRVTRTCQKIIRQTKEEIIIRKAAKCKPKNKNPEEKTRWRRSTNSSMWSELNVGKNRSKSSIKRANTPLHRCFTSYSDFCFWEHFASLCTHRANNLVVAPLFLKPKNACGIVQTHTHVIRFVDVFFRRCLTVPTHFCSFLQYLPFLFLLLVLIFRYLVAHV